MSDTTKLPDDVEIESAARARYNKNGAIYEGFVRGAQWTRGVVESRTTIQSKCDYWFTDKNDDAFQCEKPDGHKGPHYGPELRSVQAQPQQLTREQIENCKQAAREMDAAAASGHIMSCPPPTPKAHNRAVGCPECRHNIRGLELDLVCGGHRYGDGCNCTHAFHSQPQDDLYRKVSCAECGGKGWNPKTGFGAVKCTGSDDRCRGQGYWYEPVTIQANGDVSI